MKVRSETRPTELFEIQGEGERVTIILNDLTSVVEIDEGFEWCQYSTEAMNRPTWIQDHAEELLSRLKQIEYDDLAQKVREKRNALLAESDKYMALDRLGLDTSNAIAFLASLKKIFTNNWSKYRQALRDITEQEGFPYDVVFPTRPED